MKVQVELTKAEETFMLRMLPHLIMGNSFEEAGRAVLADDKRLYDAMNDRRHWHLVPASDDHGASHDDNIGKGDVIVSELCRTVYERLRAA